MTDTAPTPTAESPPAKDRTLEGVALMALGALSIPCIDAIAKLLGPGGGALGAALGAPLPPLEIAFGRFLVQTLLILPLALHAVGLGSLRPRNLGLAIARGAAITLATVLFFTGLVFFDLAEAISVFFVEPLLLTLLSALVLKERIGWRRILASIIGFIGALIVIQPKFLVFGWAALLPLGAAGCFATYLMLTKILADREHSLTLHLWAGISGSVLLGAVLIGASALELESVAPILPTASQIVGLLVLGFVATLGHFIVVMAFRRAPASQLAPLQYLEIVAAGMLGWLVFGEVMNPTAFLGVAIIILSGLFVLRRERIRSIEPSVARPPVLARESEED